MSTAESSISQKRRAGMPRNVTGLGMAWRAVDAGGVDPLGSVAGARSNMYQSAAPPSYSRATHCVAPLGEPSAKPYSMRSGDHEPAPAGASHSAPSPRRH